MLRGLRVKPAMTGKVGYCESQAAMTEKMRYCETQAAMAKKQAIAKIRNSQSPVGKFFSETGDCALRVPTSPKRFSRGRGDPFTPFPGKQKSAPGAQR